MLVLQCCCYWTTAARQPKGIQCNVFAPASTGRTRIHVPESHATALQSITTLHRSRGAVHIKPWASASARQPLTRSPRMPSNTLSAAHRTLSCEAYATQCLATTFSSTGSTALHTAQHIPRLPPPTLPTSTSRKPGQYGGTSTSINTLQHALGEDSSPAFDPSQALALRHKPAVP